LDVAEEGALIQTLIQQRELSKLAKLWVSGAGDQLAFTLRIEFARTACHFRLILSLESGIGSLTRAQSIAALQDIRREFVEKITEKTDVTPATEVPAMGAVGSR